eukprot:508550-Rhodomonas_salina.5
MSSGAAASPATPAPAPPPPAPSRWRASLSARPRPRCCSRCAAASARSPPSRPVARPPGTASAQAPGFPAPGSAECPERWAPPGTERRGSRSRRGATAPRRAEGWRRGTEGAAEAEDAQSCRSGGGMGESRGGCLFLRYRIPHPRR